MPVCVIHCQSVEGRCHASVAKTCNLYVYDCRQIRKSFEHLDCSQHVKPWLSSPMSWFVISWLTLWWEIPTNKRLASLASRRAPFWCIRCKHNHWFVRSHVSGAWFQDVSSGCQFIISLLCVKLFFERRSQFCGQDGQNKGHMEDCWLGLLASATPHHASKGDCWRPVRWRRPRKTPRAKGDCWQTDCWLRPRGLPPAQDKRWPRPRAQFKFNFKRGGVAGHNGCMIANSLEDYIMDGISFKLAKKNILRYQ